jgi:hypothetical protein
MCKPVADKTEPAVTYLTARLWLIGSTISLVAHQGETQGKPRLPEIIGGCGVERYEVRGLSVAPAAP